MWAIPNTTVTVLRGTTVSAYGDALDNTTPAASGIPALITERNRTVFDRTTQTPRVVRVVSCAVQSDTDLREEDRVRDDTTNTVYAVRSVTQPGGAGHVADLLVELGRVT